MSQLTSSQWRLSRQVLAVVGADLGLTDVAIAEKLGVTATELRPIVGMLVGRGKLVRCGDYLTLPVPPGRAA